MIRYQPHSLFLQFGDTPVCLGKDESDFLSKVASVSGYGETEDGTSGELLTWNVKIIDNQKCKEQFVHNITNYYNDKGVDTISNKLCQALPNGLDDGFVCGQGIEFDGGDCFQGAFYSGSCKGDSGGPMTALDDDNRETLIGIVSGKKLFEHFKYIINYIQEVLVVERAFLDGTPESLIIWIGSIASQR